MIRRYRSMERATRRAIAKDLAALERSPQIAYVPMPDALRGKYQYRTEATIDRLRAAGYAVHTQTIPVAITQKNRLLLGEPSR